MNIVSIFVGKIHSGIRLLVSHLHKIYNTFVYIFKPNNKYILLNSWINLYNNKIIHNNWGDDINYYFLRDITKKHIFNLNNIIKLFIPSSETNYLVIGSIIESHCNHNSIIWGSGAMCGEHELKAVPKQVLAVRGPLTRDFLLSKGIECPEVYGDPALLISKYYRPLVEKKFKVGIIPHYVDLDNPNVKRLKQQYPNDINIINLKRFDDWHEIIDKIYECEFILSSSLHGLIISDSYDIPNLWVKFSDKIGGGNFKYLDYFKSVNRTTNTSVDANTFVNLEEILKYKNNWQPIMINLQPLIDSCPFNEIKSEFKNE